MPVKIDDRKWKHIMRQLKIWENAFTAIGIHEGEQDHKEGQTTMVLIAAVQEFGTNKAGKNHNIIIPSRPWMRSWFDKNKNKILKKMKKLYNKIVDGKLTAKQALKKLGEWAQGELRMSIRNLQSPPNAPSTIRQKGSSNPLIDTGQLINTVRHEEFYGKDMKLVS